MSETNRRFSEIISSQYEHGEFSEPEVRVYFETPEELKTAGTVINRKIGEAVIGESIAPSMNQHVTRVDGDPEGTISVAENTATGATIISRNGKEGHTLHVANSEGLHEVPLNNEPRPLNLSLPETEEQIAEWREDNK